MVGLNIVFGTFYSREMDIAGVNMRGAKLFDYESQVTATTAHVEGSAGMEIFENLGKIVGCESEVRRKNVFGDLKCKVVDIKCVWLAGDDLT